MIIAGRQGIMGGKGLSAKSYVQDGLIAMWDGIENAGWGTHDANATVWKGLVGEGVDLELQGGATWTDKGLHFDGTGVAIADNPSHGWTGVGTLETVQFLEKTNGAAACVANIGDTWSSFAVFFNSYNVNIEGLGGVQPRRAINQQSLLLGKTATITRRSQANIAINAVEYASDNGNWISELNSGKTLIGARADMTRALTDCDVFCVRVYNRALTADEIAHNYAVDKERFGL